MHAHYKTKCTYGQTISEAVAAEIDYEAKQQSDNK